MRIIVGLIGDPRELKGGAMMTALQNIKALQQAGHKLRIVHPGDAEEAYEFEGIEAHQICSPNIYWRYRNSHPKWQKLAWHFWENYNPRAYQAMRRQIEEFKPDILYTISIENINVGSWRAAKKLGVPCMHQAVSSFLLCWKSTMMSDGKLQKKQNFLQKITSLGKKSLSQQVDGLIGETNFIVNLHLENGYFKNAKTKIVQTAFETELQTAPTKRKARTTLRVGFLGELSYLKGPDLIADASQELKDIDIEYILGGADSENLTDKLKAKFGSANAKFLGWTSADDFFAQTDILILPSRGSEAFGRVMIEAYLRGLPVIGSDSGGIPESIENGVTGFVFESNNASALAQNIRAFYDDHALYNDMAKAAFNKANNYTVENFLSQIEPLMHALVAD